MPAATEVPMKKKPFLIIIFLLAAAAIAGSLLYLRFRPVASAVSEDGRWKGWIVKTGENEFTGYLAFQEGTGDPGEIHMQYCGDTACRYGTLTPDEEPFGTLQALVLGSRTKVKYSIAAYPPGVPEALQYIMEWQENGEKRTDTLMW